MLSVKFRPVFSFLLLLTLLAGCSGANRAEKAPPVMTALDAMDRAKQSSQATDTSGAAAIPATATNVDTDSDVPAEGTFKVRFETTAGNFVVLVHRDWAPRGAQRFYELVEAKFYDQCRFFRVVPDFMVQFGINGDPNVQDKWKKNLVDDPVKQSNKRGYMTFATAGEHSRTTQVFINFKNNDFLDSQGFAPFAEVIEGMENVDAIYSGYLERPDQGAIQAEGNNYLERSFPKLDYVMQATVLKE